MNPSLIVLKSNSHHFEHFVLPMIFVFVIVVLSFKLVDAVLVLVNAKLPHKLHVVM